MVKNKLKSKFSYRVLRILLIVIVGLLIIAGVFHVFNKRDALFSPQQKTVGNCQEKTWCLDYDTVAHMGADCSVVSRDCSQEDKCTQGICVVR